jgi:hypothetical protein
MFDQQNIAQMTQGIPALKLMDEEVYKIYQLLKDKNI